MLKMRDLLIQNGFNVYHLKADTDAGKGHNESYWAEKFPVVLRWLFEEELPRPSNRQLMILADGFNALILPADISDQIAINAISTCQMSVENT